VLPNYAAATFVGGEVVGMQAGITRGAEATVWSAELEDTMASTDVTFTYGNKATSATSSTSVSYSNCTFAGGATNDRALIFLDNYTNSSAGTDSSPTSLTITPSAGGAGINCTKLGFFGTSPGRGCNIYRSDSDIAATDYNITGTRPSASRSNIVMWGTLHGADPTPTTALSDTSGSASNPQVTGSLTCVANGLLIGGFTYVNNITNTQNTGTTVLDQTFFNSEYGLTLAVRTSTGTLSITASNGAPLAMGRGIVAFGPI
jgi:hypothetical protein